MANPKVVFTHRVGELIVGKLIGDGRAVVPYGTWEIPPNIGDVWEVGIEGPAPESRVFVTPVRRLIEGKGRPAAMSDLVRTAVHGPKKRLPDRGPRRQSGRSPVQRDAPRRAAGTPVQERVPSAHPLEGQIVTVTFDSGQIDFPYTTIEGLQAVPCDRKGWGAKWPRRGEVWEVRILRVRGERCFLAAVKRLPRN